MTTKLTHDSLWAKWRRLLAPGYSHCLRCGMPWSIVEGHIIRGLDGKGAFPCCTQCWPEMTLGERSERLDALLNEWERTMPGHTTPEHRTALFGAVERGE